MRHSSKNHAALRLLLCVVALTAAATAQTAAVEGSVTNSLTGQPILRAHVTLLSGGGKPQIYGALTDSDGSYRITNLPPGEYTLRAQRTGFVDSASPMTAKVKVADGDIRTAQNLKLVPQGAITGRIVTPGGEPMPGVEVEARSDHASRGSATTDEKGAFRIGGLKPGKFRLRSAMAHLPYPPEIRSDGSEEIHYSHTYYPNATDEKSAMRVEVLPGGETSGIVIHALRTPIMKLSGVVRGIPEKAGGVFLSADGDGVEATVDVKPDGTFEIWRLDPGQYLLTAILRNGGQVLRSPPTEVEVGTSNLDRIELRLVPPSTLTGQVEYDDDAAKPVKSDDAAKVVRRVLLEGMFSGSRGAAQLSEDGFFTLPNLQPDRYRISLSWRLGYVKSIRANGTEVDGDMLDLRKGATSDGVAIRVSSKVAGIAGTVSDDKGPVTGAHVFAALEDQIYRRPPLMVVTDAGGAYSFTGMAPGKYKLLAVDDGDFKPGFFEEYDEKGEIVELRADDRLSRDLKLYTGPKY